ncbi:MAG: hypothetical protein AAB592_03685, partial [Patescibacteria group bacterium]
PFGSNRKIAQSPFLPYNQRSSPFMLPRNATLVARTLYEIHVFLFGYAKLLKRIPILFFFFYRGEYNVSPPLRSGNDLFIKKI